MPESALTQTSSAVLPGNIERDSPVPYYFQLATLFEHEILSGRWPPGLRLPSEAEICNRYTISRTTVRQSLARLEQPGLIERVRGQGTYVGYPRARSWMLHSPLGLFEGEMHRLGRVTSVILRAEVGSLPSWATDALGLPPGSNGATLERLRFIEGNVVLYVINHLPLDFAEAAVSFDDPDDSLYRRLRERHGLEVASGTRNIEAIKAEDRLALLLEVSVGTPLAFIESLSWDHNLRPFDCYRAWLRTDRLKIELQIAASTPSVAAVGSRPGRMGRDRIA